jgi:hypothetical protein
VIIKGVKGCEMINGSDFVRVWELKNGTVGFVTT